MEISKKIAFPLLAILLSIMLYLPFMNFTMQGHHHDSMEACLINATPSICPMTQLQDFFQSFGSATTHIFQILNVQVSILATLLTMILLFIFPKLETAFASLPPPRWRLALSRGLIHPKSY